MSTILMLAGLGILALVLGALLGRVELVFRRCAIRRRLRDEIVRPRYMISSKGLIRVLQMEKAAAEGKNRDL